MPAGRRPGGGPWDRDVHWAFAAADRRKGPRRLVPPYRYRSVLVTEAAPRLPFGRSVHASGYLTHLVAAVYLAWRHGRVVAMHARWRCGSGTLHFRLLDEPDSTVCPACTIERLPRPVAA